MSWINNNYQLAELTWEKGQLSMNGLGLGSNSRSSSPKPIWANRTSNDTLESIVHQATFLKPPPPRPRPPPPTAVLHPPPDSKSATTATCRKRSRSDSNVGNKSSRFWDFGSINTNHINYGEGEAERSSAAASGGESDGTVLTWPLPASFHLSCSKRTSPAHASGRSRSRGEDSLEEDEEDESNKTETTSTKSLSSANMMRSRTATVHNQSERRRRERINQKMKALQKLVPNAHKTDKASMLEEVIDYLKQLQAQVEMMSHARNMVAVAPQMMIPIDALHHHQQQQQQKLLQMSILAATHGASMGVGLGMGMMPAMHNINPLAHTATLLHLPTTMTTSPAPINTTTPQFLHHQVAHINNNNCQTNSTAPTSSISPFDALAQSKNMELYMGKLAAIYQQQLHQLGSVVHGTHAINGASQQSNRNQGEK